MMFGKNPGTDKTATLIPEGSIGAELGVWKGDSSAKFIKRAKHIHLVDSWTVEAYQGSDEHGGYDAYLNRYSELVGSDNPCPYVLLHPKTTNLIYELSFYLQTDTQILVGHF